MTHQLDDARGQMREGHTSAQWELIAREKVARTLLETGEFTADDLADLNVPVEYRRHVHGAVTGYFSGEKPYMKFVELRKSERPSRKGAKNQAFGITAKGLRELPRLLRDLQAELPKLVGQTSCSSLGHSGDAAGLSGEEQGPLVGLDAQEKGKGERNEVEQSLTAPSTGRGLDTEAVPHGAGSPKSIESGESSGVGQHPSSDDKSSASPPVGADTDVGSPDSLVQLEGVRKAPSMYDPMVEDAA